MVDIELMIKSLRLAWIKRLLFRDNYNLKIVTDYFFNKHGGLNFLLLCNYDVKYLRHIPTFYRDILIAFDVTGLCTVMIKERTPFSLITKTS